jgi:hypothetical protein
MIVGRPAAMWRSLHRQRLTIFRRPGGVIFFAFFSALVWVLLLSRGDNAGAQEEQQEEQFSTAGLAGQLIRLREHAGWNRHCEAIASPVLYLSEPPLHGSVCARVENIQISSMFVGTESQCIGRLVRGVRLIYRPDAAYAGNDSLRYMAQYPSILRAIQVQVTVTAASNSTIVAPMAQVRQEAGPVPDCAAQIF